MHQIESLQWDAVQGAANPWVSIPVATLTGAVVATSMLFLTKNNPAAIIGALSSALVAGRIAEIVTTD